MNEKIEWDPKYSVDVEEIDIHQKKMFEMFNQLVEMKQTKADPKDFANLVSDINDYSKVYFSREEKILKKKGYPDYESHAKAHRQFIRNSISLRREMAEDVGSMNLEGALDLRNWLINHIEKSDSLYIPFLRIHQFIEEKTQKN